MLNRDALAERRAEDRGRGRRQRDLGHHQQHAAARLAHRAREAQVDLGLAAAGDAVQQRGVIRAPPARAAQRVERRLLLVGERRPVDVASVRRRGLERIALDAPPFDRDEPQREPGA